MGDRRIQGLLYTLYPQLTCLCYVVNRSPQHLLQPALLSAGHAGYVQHVCDSHGCIRGLYTTLAGAGKCWSVVCDVWHDPVQLCSLSRCGGRRWRVSGVIGIRVMHVRAGRGTGRALPSRIAPKFAAATDRTPTANHNMAQPCTCAGCCSRAVDAAAHMRYSTRNHLVCYEQHRAHAPWSVPNAPSRWSRRRIRSVPNIQGGAVWSCCR